MASIWSRYKGLLEEYSDIMAVFQVTLDGPKDVHDSRRHRLGGQGTFDEITRGVNLLLELGIDVSLRVNVNKANIDSLPRLVDFVMEKGWDQSEHLQFSLAPVTMHSKQGCKSDYDKAMTELEIAKHVMTLIDRSPAMANVCHMGFLRHLEHLSAILEPKQLGKARVKPHIKGRSLIGPRYWYCEASTSKSWAFTPEGMIYACTELLGRPQHAVGRFDPDFEMWTKPHGQWIGRTILSHPKCRACSISTLCGGGCHLAARESADLGKPKLMQIALGKPKGISQAIALAGDRPGKIDADLAATVHLPHSAEQTAVDPFCGMAEETVRTYLRYMGDKLAAQSRTAAE